MADQRLKDQRLKKQLGPGVWVDRQGALHFSVPQILRMLHVKDTPENREQCIKTLNAVLAKEVPDAEVVHQESCPACGSNDYHTEACPLGLATKRTGD